MIPVEYFWGILILVFAIIGAARGLTKELGASAVLLLSLFALYMGWDLLGDNLFDLVHGRAANATLAGVRAIYFMVVLVFVAYISYAGFVLDFPVKAMTGLAKGFFGFLGGLFNGYLIVGSLWDVVARAGYFQAPPWATSWNLTAFHNEVVEWLPLTLMGRSSPYIALVLGMILLLAIVLK